MFRISSMSSASSLPLPLRSMRSTSWTNRSGIAVRSRLSPAPSRRTVSMPVPPSATAAVPKPRSPIASRSSPAAAVQKVAPAVADQGVVALGADEDLAGARTDEDVVAVVAEPVDRAGEVAAEHDVALAGVAVRRIGAGSADDQVGEAIAVDIARAAHRTARDRTRRCHRGGSRWCRRGSRGRARHRSRGLAEHDVALTGIMPAEIGGAPTIRSAKPSPLTSPAPLTESR